LESLAAKYSAATNKGASTSDGLTVDSVAKVDTLETYFCVEGSGIRTSQNRISVNAYGSVTINSGCSWQLCVSTNGPNHASYYLTNKRADGSVVVFEVDAALHEQIMDAAVQQRPMPGVPGDPNAPKIVDPNQGKPSISLELLKVWDRLIEQNSSKAHVLTKESSSMNLENDCQLLLRSLFNGEKSIAVFIIMSLIIRKIIALM